MIAQISPAELTARLQAQDAPLVLDVREPWEFATCAIAGATHVPMREIPGRISDLDSDREIVCVCHHGMRSLQVGVFLARNGFARVYNLAGGIDAWARDVEPTMPRY
jgi:rhodanese-related sulfurtransferase